MTMRLSPRHGARPARELRGPLPGALGARAAGGEGRAPRRDGPGWRRHVLRPENWGVRQGEVSTASV